MVLWLIRVPEVLLVPLCDIWDLAKKVKIWLKLDSSEYMVSADSDK